MTNTKPEWVVNFQRPAGTEIKLINGHYYLYERFSVYDPETKKKRKKSGKMLGKLTPYGFVPKKTKLEPEKLHHIENLEYGASMYLYESSSQIMKHLEECFPHIWKEIFAMALLRCKEQTPFKRMGYHYSTSYLSKILGPLSLSASSITKLLKQIGTDRQAIRRYMMGDLVNRSGIIMVDGHRLITASTTHECARVGYDSKMRYLPQINLVYLFSAAPEGRLPVYYKQFSGDVPDVSAFSEILTDCGLSAHEVTLIADKGFSSNENFYLITDSDLSYIIPLRRGSKEIEPVPSSLREYDQLFTFRGHPVYAKTYTRDGYQVILYHDTSLANNETADLIDRLNKKNASKEVARQKEQARRKKGKGKLNDKEFGKLIPIDVTKTVQEHIWAGCFILQTNRMDLNIQQVHQLYKTRQEIEQTFKSYDNTLDSSSSYMRDVHSSEAWLFINHLALQMLYGILDRIASYQLTDRYSFNDMIAYLKGIRVNIIDQRSYISKITKKTKELCSQLDLNLELPK
ncbi:MAG: transposase [Spirochaetia bacterium]|nr:transposase [Spirochaetia bacterium]